MVSLYWWTPTTGSRDFLYRYSHLKLAAPEIVAICAEHHGGADVSKTTRWDNKLGQHNPKLSALATAPRGRVDSVPAGPRAVSLLHARLKCLKPFRCASIGLLQGQKVAQSQARTHAWMRLDERLS